MSTWPLLLLTRFIASIVERPLLNPNCLSDNSMQSSSLWQSSRSMVLPSVFRTQIGRNFLVVPFVNRSNSASFQIVGYCCFYRQSLNIAIHSRFRRWISTLAISDTMPSGPAALPGLAPRVALVSSASVNGGHSTVRLHYSIVG